MKKNTKNKTQKSKSFSDILFKILLGAVVLVFVYIIIDTPKDSFSFSNNKLRSNSNTFAPKTEKPQKPAPSELKWFDSFKGISNK